MDYINTIKNTTQSFMDYANELIGKNKPNTEVAEGGKPQQSQQSSSPSFEFSLESNRSTSQQKSAMVQPSSYKGGRRQALDPNITALYTPLDPNNTEVQDVTKQFGGYSGF